MCNIESINVIPYYIVLNCVPGWYMCVLEPQLIRYYNRELKASYKIYAFAIKTLRDISPSFEACCYFCFAWCFRFFLLLSSFTIRSRATLVLHWWHVSSVHSIMRSFVCFCKYLFFYLHFVQLFTVCHDLPRFINVNEFSSAVSHISKFLFLFVFSLRSLHCIRQFCSLYMVCVCVYNILCLRKM